MFVRRTCLVLVSAAVAACSSGSSSIPESQLSAKLSTAYCTKLLTCCAGQSGLPTEASCESQISAGLASGFATLEADPKTTYNGSAAASCIAEFSAAGCNLDFGAGTSCDQVFAGSLANGATCNSGTECSSTLCVNLTFDNSGNVTSAGICAAQGAANQACTGSTTNGSSGNSCVTGTYGASDGNSCTCTPTLANGTACPDGNDSCTSGYCDPTATQCAAPPSTLTSQECQQELTN